MVDHQAGQAGEHLVQPLDLEAVHAHLDQIVEDQTAGGANRQRQTACMCLRVANNESASERERGQDLNGSGAGQTRLVPGRARLQAGIDKSGVDAATISGVWAFVVLHGG